MERLRKVEDENRKENLKIVGIPDTSGEKFEQTWNKAQKLISEKLGLPSMKIIDAYRAGKPSAQQTSSRPIIAKLQSVNDKVSCFKSSIRLKGSEVFLSDDVCKATADIRRQKLDVLKEKRREGFIAYFRGAEIITKRRRDNHRSGSSTEPPVGDGLQLDAATGNAGALGTPVPDTSAQTVPLTTGDPPRPQRTKSNKPRK